MNLRQLLSRFQLSRSAVNSVTVILLIICAIQFISIVRKGETEFEWVYVRSARHLLAGHDVYNPPGAPFKAFTYPPFMAVLAVPYAYLPKPTERWLWYLTNVACFVVLWRAAWNLSGGENSGSRPEQWIAGLGFTCGLLYALSNLDHQQTDLVVSALLIVGGLKLVKGSDLLAATLFGLAAGMKCTALLWMPFLFVRGRWKATVLLLAVALGVNLIPDLIARSSSGGIWLVEWFGRYLKPMGSSGYYPGKWFAWILDNQSIAGAATRWSTTQWTWSKSAGIEIVDRTAIPSARIIQLLVYAIEFMLLASALWLVRKSRTRQSGDLNVQALEASIVMMLMLLFSPMSSRPHFSTMFLPGLCLARAAVNDHSKRQWAAIWLGLAIAASLFAAPIWGRSIARLSMWLGMLSWSAGFLLIGCWGLLRSANTPSASKQSALRMHASQRRLPSEREIV